MERITIAMKMEALSNWIRTAWNKVGEEYLYVEDGELLTDCIAFD